MSRIYKGIRESLTLACLIGLRGREVSFTTDVLLSEVAHGASITGSIGQEGDRVRC